MNADQTKNLNLSIDFFNAMKKTNGVRFNLKQFSLKNFKTFSNYDGMASNTLNYMSNFEVEKLFSCMAIIFKKTKGKDINVTF